MRVCGARDNGIVERRRDGCLRRRCCGKVESQHVVTRYVSFSRVRILDIQHSFDLGSPTSQSGRLFPNDEHESISRCSTPEWLPRNPISSYPATSSCISLPTSKSSSLVFCTIAIILMIPIRPHVVRVFVVRIRGVPLPPKPFIRSTPNQRLTFQTFQTW